MSQGTDMQQNCNPISLAWLQSLFIGTTSVQPAFAANSVVHAANGRLLPQTSHYCATGTVDKVPQLV